MRLLLVTNDYPPKPGGIQQYLGNFVAAYPDEIRVLAPADPSANDEPGVVRSNSRFMWPSRSISRWVEAEARAFGPDVVLFGAPHPLPLLGSGLRTELGVPYGVLSHGAEVTLAAAIPGIRSVVRRGLREADVLFAVSQYTAGNVSRLTGRDVTFVGAGVDVDVFRPGPPPGNEVPIVGCVSRFVPRKGQHRLIRAVARMNRPVDVLLVGKGRTERRLRALADRLGVRVRFAVDVAWNELPDLYRRMDVFCMPCRSRWFGLEAEGLGLVYLEAAACGLPVVAGDSGGSPETVRRGSTGYVVHSVGDITEGLEIFHNDPGRARAMGQEGRRMVEAEFTWARVVDRFREGFAAVV